MPTEASAAGNRLDAIVARTRKDLVAWKTPESRRELEGLAADHTPRGFADALRVAARSRPAVIAELKKASPSKGLIRADFEPTHLAVALEAAGAACLSVLTDEPHFSGSLFNLAAASQAVRIPCLRKDFMVDEFQILEARAHGADAILLIVAALTDAELKRLRQAARLAELDVLCEVHDREELQRALQLDCEMIGVNARDLRTFAVDHAEVEAMGAMLPKGVVRVAESGITSGSDIARLRATGYDAFLVGETLMRADDPGAALRALLSPAAAG